MTDHTHVRLTFRVEDFSAAVSIERLKQYDFDVQAILDGESKHDAVDFFDLDEVRDAFDQTEVELDDAYALTPKGKA